MACNCKEVRKLEDIYGIGRDDSGLKGAYMTLWKIFTMLMGLVIGIVVVPIVVFVMIYNQLFRGGKPIKLPVWLLKKKSKE